MEQFQAQVSAALRPAFKSSAALADPSPEITAAACEVCACWLTSGVPREAADLRRIHDLLTASLDVLRDDSGAATTTAISTNYSEASATRLKLAVLCAWAEVFIASTRFRDVALQAIQTLSMLESFSSTCGEDDGGVGGGKAVLLGLMQGDTMAWGRPSVGDVSALLEKLEATEDLHTEDEEYEENGDDDEDRYPDGSLTLNQELLFYTLCSVS